MQLSERQVELLQSGLSGEQALTGRQLWRGQRSVHVRHGRRLRVHRGGLVLQLSASYGAQNNLLGGRLGVPLAGLPSK